MPALPSIHPLDEETPFVAEVSDVDLSADLSDQAFAAIEAALDRYAVLVLPNQPLDEQQQLAFARRFGPLETSIGPSMYNKAKPRRLQQAELSDISNLDEGGALIDAQDVRRLINLSNRLWHTDSSFKRTPAKVSMLSAQEVVATGGQTEFADLRAAWDALPAARQQALRALVAEHDFFHSRSKLGFEKAQAPAAWREHLPPVPQSLVRVHPGSGRTTLYLASHIRGIFGMPQPQARALVDELTTFATQPQFTYLHRWRVNDLVIWDNRCTMHRGRPFDESQRRSMRRATVSDAGPAIPEEWIAPTSDLNMTRVNH